MVVNRKICSMCGSCHVQAMNDRDCSFSNLAERYESFNIVLSLFLDVSNLT